MVGGEERVTAMTHAEQLERWANGESVHIGDRCTPDFSCCKPALQATEEIRRAFMAAPRSSQLAFLGDFLSAAMELHKKERAGGGEARR